MAFLKRSLGSRPSQGAGAVTTPWWGLLLALGASVGLGCGSAWEAAETERTEPSSPRLSWLSARTDPEAGIRDAAGRQVLLRGVNMNHLGDYFETHPSLPTVSELTAEDWTTRLPWGTTSFGW
jgi:hypothetical protein